MVVLDRWTRSHGRSSLPSLTPYRNRHPRQLNNLTGRVFPRSKLQKWHTSEELRNKWGQAEVDQTDNVPRETRSDRYFCLLCTVCYLLSIVKATMECEIMIGWNIRQRQDYRYFLSALFTAILIVLTLDTGSLKMAFSTVKCLLMKTVSYGTCVVLFLPPIFQEPTYSWWHSKPCCSAGMSNISRSWELL